MATVKHVLRAAAIAALVASTCRMQRLMAQPAPLEYRLKAALVSKFPEFVEWPPSALNGRATINLCVAGPSPFGSDLDELIAGADLNGRPMVVRRVDRESDVDACQLLFVPRRPGGGRNLLLERATRLPILTIGDDPAFLDEGGIVRLLVVEGRVRFDIDTSAARRAGLRISSQLLQLAVSVRGNEP